MSFADEVNVRIAASGAAETLASLVAVRTELRAMQGQAVALKVDTTALQTVRNDAASAQTAMRALSAEQVVVRADTVGLQAVRTNAEAAQTAVKALAAEQVAVKADTAGLKAVTTEAQAAGTAAKALSGTNVVMKVDASQIAGVRTAMQGLNQDAITAGASFAKLAAPTALVAGLGLAAKASSDLSTSLSQLQANTTLTDAQMQQVTTSVRHLASTTPTGIDQLAASFREVTNEGFSVADAMKIVTEANMSAIATGAKTADVTNSLAIVMHDFSIPATQAAQAMNVLHLAAAEGNVTLSDFSANSAKVWADAGKLGVGFTDAAAALSALTKSGYSAADSATLLDSLMVKILAPTKASEAALRSISKTTGVDLVNDFTMAGIAAKGLPGVLDDIQKALHGDQAAVFSFLPALRGGRGEIALTNAEGIAFRGTLDELNATFAGKTTPTADAFARAMGLTSSQVGELRNQVTLAAADIGGGLAPAINAVLHIFTAFDGTGAKIAIDIGLAVAALKTASITGDLLVATVAKLTTATAANTAATVTETAVVDADSASWLANAAARGRAMAIPILGGLGIGLAVGGPIVGGLEDKALAGTRNRTVTNDADAQYAQSIRDAATAGRDVDLEKLKQTLAFDEKALADYKPNPIMGFATMVGFKDPMAEMLKQRATFVQQMLDEAQRAEKSPAANPTTGAAAPAALSDAEVQSLQDHYDLLAQKRDELLAKGAPAALVNHVLYPEDFDQTKQQLTQAKADLAEWQRQYTATETAAKAAQTELAKVDVSKGIAGFASMAEGLTKVNAGLARVGQADSAIADLATIADQFSAIAKQTDAASASYDGYMALISNTDKYESKLSAFKKEVDAGVAAAQEAVARGTATPDQIALLKDAPNIYGHIAESMATLDAHKAGDVLAIAKDMPDWGTADTLTRNVAENLGGIKAVDMRVSTEKDQAIRDIEELIAHPHVVRVQVQAEGGVGTAGGSGPLLLTTQGGQADPTRGYGDNGSGVGATGDVGNFKHFSPISSAEWAGIVPANSPLAGGDTLDQLNAAAMKAGVDPRYLAAYLAQEGNFSTAGGEGAWQVGAKNPGGLLYADQQGATMGVPNEAGKPYATFGSYGDYFKAMTDTLTKQPGWMHNDPAELAGDWTKGPGAAGTDGFNEAAQSKLAFYRRYLQGAGGTGAGGYKPDQVAASEHLTTQQAIDQANDVSAPSGVVSTSSVFAAAQQHLGQKMTKAGLEVYGWCENIVDDILGDVDRDPRGKGFTGTADEHIRAAMAGTPGAGKVVSQADARPGDIVGWTGDNPSAGDPRGHIGIYSGGDKYIGTTQNGVQERTLAPGAIFIRPDGVVANGPEPGTTQYKYSPTTVAGSEHLTTQASQPAVGNVNFTDPANPAYTEKTLINVTNQARVLKGVLETLTPEGGKQLLTYFDKTFDAEKRVIEQTMQGANKGGALSQTQQQQAGKQAMQATFDLWILAGRAMADMEGHTGNVAADLQKIRDVGGPVAANLANQVQAWGQMRDAAQVVAADQQTITNLDLANTQRKQQEAADDKAASRQKQEDAWAAQATKTAEAEAYRIQQEGFANRRTAEGDAWTVESRRIEDRKRALQFSQQVQATDLQNKLTDLQKSQQSGVYQRTSEEQLVAASVKGAGTNQEAAALAAKLAGMHDADLATRDANTRAIDDIQLQIRAEQKKANLESYNLETESLKETRAHEDRLKGIDVEAHAVDVAYQARQRAEAALATQQQIADTRAQWDLQDIRQKKDEQYTVDKAAADATLKRDEAHAKSLSAQEGMATAAETTWGKIAALVGTPAIWLLAAISQIAGVDNAAIHGIHGTASQLGGGAIRNLSGIPAHAAGTAYSDAGLAQVNEQGGELRVLQSGEAIIPADQTRRLLAGGGGGDQYFTFDAPISVSGGGWVDEEAIVARALREAVATLEPKIRQAVRAGRERQRAMGA